MIAVGETRESDAAVGSDAEGLNVDVLIVGAGISGIGSAFHLQDQCPGKSYLILEAKESFGGTWHTHQYPGVRSDSDLYTFGYRFKPWVGAPIASGSEILKYLNEVIAENGIDKNIRYGHRITACHWSSAQNRWTVEALRLADHVPVVLTARFLWMCQGYYDHERPYVPDWPGRSTYGGVFQHAQLWDPATDCAGKRVLVIGSGATAATLVPALAKEAEHVTMLQRSPTYFYCSPNRNELADRLREIGIDEPTIHRVVRAQISHDQDVMTRRCMEEPDTVFEELKAAIRTYAGEDFEIGPEFTPKYRVWQQRLAFCPEGDLFQAVRDGKVDVVTDQIERFTETGVVTMSGRAIDADVIIAATGFRLLMMGNILCDVDGRPVDWHETVTYRGMMFTGVPNMAWVMGYFRASWTLRVDLLADFVCRLLRHMDEQGAERVEVQLGPDDAGMPLLPWIDSENFNPGYLLRGLDQMPLRGDKPEWMHNQDYWREREEIPAINLDGPEFRYAT
ncbi:NAD(P)/FAD-dependent oxidoreductase [Sphingomonas sp. IC-11]|uniref:flavin-containing monooxygenase n=1 Tax=Sphingomonas sp. IC-11 TaxID=2898528 RepID=UPI001E2DEF3A|nr:NAD(P)/FAD-dependent oxidoreductase [Sphingomonas sp. IC-11]MCD2316197.1 NAD(P)/FAD-dependent oxidoreductase [Sphingomonas sp. IC-11]